jgi:CheY-like chemotaxis protein/signal transduction histidine kinase
MPSVADLIEYAEPIAAAMACGTILDRFLDTPGLDLLVVVEADRPLGVVCRAAMLGHDSAQSAANIMGEPLTIDAGMKITAACELLLAHRDPLAGLVVVEDNRYVGVVSSRALLRSRHENTHVAEENHRFAELVSHEVRSSLNGVLAVAELLQRQPLTVDSQAYVRTILDAGHTTLRALNDALELSRAEAGQLEFDPQPTVLRTLMDDVQTRWQTRAAQDGVTLLVAYDGEPALEALIDAGRVKQVFDKLIDTALTINRRGVVEASLRAVRTPDGLRLIGRVRDTGGGLSTVKLEAPSAGSGLALCLRIIERMQGTIRADSNVGAGATIEFEYPAGVAIAEPSNPVADMGGLKRAAHVLVVDDNATNRMVAEALCEMFDCTSECVEDGVEAVEAARSGRFDLILMDIRMPRMDGVEATLAIRALPGSPGQVPIIALTANADPEDTKAYIAAGMQSVVEKPLKPERLLQAINDVLSDAPGQAAAA